MENKELEKETIFDILERYYNSVNSLDELPLGDIEDDIEFKIKQALSTQRAELEKEWLEAYGDLTKQFSELQDYKEKTLEKIMKALNVELKDVPALPPKNADIISLVLKIGLAKQTQEILKAIKDL